MLSILSKDNARREHVGWNVSVRVTRNRHDVDGRKIINQLFAVHGLSGKLTTLLHSDCFLGCSQRKCSRIEVATRHMEHMHTHTHTNVAPVHQYSSIQYLLLRELA